MSDKMPSLDLVQFEGLATKQNPETLKPTQLRECKNADFFREYGSLSKIRGNAHVLNGQYSESAVTKGIYWGTNYKAQDLSGVIDRQVLIGAGTTLRKINENGTTTELLDGEPDALYRTSGQLDRFLFITSQDPFDVGKRGQMSKYDGTRVTKWGLTAPGGQVIKYTNGGAIEEIDTPIEDFNDASLFTASNATATDSTAPAWSGTAVKMVKGTSSTSAYIERLNLTPFLINTIVEDRAQLQVYIPKEDYRKLAFSGRAISVYIGSGATLSSGYYRYDFQIGRLYEGWNTLVFDFSVFPTGDFGMTFPPNPDDTNLASYRFEVITNDAADTPTVYWDDFSSFDEGAPTPTFGDEGGVLGGTVFGYSSTSFWTYKITFVDDTGFESNGGPESIEADNTSGTDIWGQIDLTFMPISSNPAVVQRVIYRTVASGSQFLYLGTINDNVTTTYKDTTPDGSLGSDIPPILGELIFDNSPPPSGGTMLILKRTAFVAGDPLNPTILAYSRFDLPQAFPIYNAIEFDERVTGLFKTAIGMVVTTESAYWRVLGDNPDYIVDRVIDGFGGVGPRAVGTAREIGWAVDRDGMRLYDLRSAIKISEVIRDRVDAFYKADLEDTHTVHSRKDNSILWLNKDSEGVYSDVYLYQYLIDDVRQGWFSQIVPNPTTFDMQCAWEVEDLNGDHKLYVGTSGGMVHEMMAEGAMNWLDDAGQSRAITLDFQTPYLRLGILPEAMEYAGQSGRVVPRQIELRVKENNGAAHTWTVVVDTCDSAATAATVRATQTLTFAFKAGQSLLRLPTSDLVPGEYLRIRVKNEQKDVDVSVMGLKIYYIPHAGQFAVTGDAAAGGQN